MLTRPRSASRRIATSRPALVPGRSVAAATVTLVASLALTATGCAATAQDAGQSGGDPVSAAALVTLEEWNAADADARRAALATDERALGALVIDSAGLTEELGMTAAEIEAALPRTAYPAADPAADASASGSALEVDPASFHGVGGTGAMRAASRVAAKPEPRDAAFSAVETLLDTLAGDLAGAADGEESWSDGDPADGWTSSGSAQGGGLSSTAESRVPTTVGGVAMTLETSVNADLSVCPDEAGLVSGTFTITGGVTAPGSDGAPQKTQVSVLLELDALVGEDAYAVDAHGTFETHLQTGTPGSSAGGFGSVASTTTYRGEIQVGYAGGEGTGKANRVRVTSGQKDSALGDTARDLALQLQHGALQAAESFWRGGSCVDVEAVASPSSIGRAGTTTIDVTATATSGVPTIDDGKTSFTGENKGSVGGSVSPEVQQRVPAAFDFVAENADGTAQPRFQVTSRRGIGFGMAAINVGQNGWMIDATVAEQHFTATKCDGVAGQWAMVVTGPEGYFASATMTLDDTLRGTWEGTVAGTYHWTGEVWFAEEGDGYVMHATGGDFDPMLPVRPAPAGTCGK